MVQIKISVLFLGATKDVIHFFSNFFIAFLGVTFFMNDARQRINTAQKSINITHIYIYTL